MKLEDLKVGYDVSVVTNDDEGHSCRMGVGTITKIVDENEIWVNFEDSYRCNGAHFPCRLEDICRVV